MNNEELGIALVKLVDELAGNLPALSNKEVSSTWAQTVKQMFKVVRIAREIDDLEQSPANIYITRIEEDTKSDDLCEADPNGIAAHSAGAKLDSGKIYADAILSEMPRAIWGIAEVGTFGAKKYSLGGWTSVEDGVRRYRDAAARHRLKRQMGEVIDPDSGLKHEYHEAWNILASLELVEREKS